MRRTPEEIAEDLDDVATWLTGPRRTKVERLAAELRDAPEPEPTVQEKRDAEKAERKRAAAATPPPPLTEGDSAPAL